VAAQPRCGLCGHRFRPVSDVPPSEDEAAFPGRIALFGVAITLASLVVGMVWILTGPGHETMTVGFMVVLRVGIVDDERHVVYVYVWRL
jgi:hypothetical protein